MAFKKEKKWERKKKSIPELFFLKGKDFKRPDECGYNLGTQKSHYQIMKVQDF